MPPRRHRFPLISALVVTALLLLWLLWDWNWFKPLVERQASSALGRAVTLENFDVEVSRQPLVSAEGIVIADPEGFPNDSRTGTVEAVRVRFDLFDLFDRQLNLLEIAVEKADAELRRNVQGLPNWQLPPTEEKDPADEPFFELRIGRLRIDDSRVHFFDPQYKSDFRVRVKTLAAAEAAEDSIRADLTGRYAGEAIAGYFLGGSLLGLRDAAQPYRVEAAMAHGATKLGLKGSVAQPSTLGGATLRLTLAGADLGALFPLLGVPLPATPPYELAGALDYVPGIFRFTNFQGRVGSSDLSGTFRLEPFLKVPKLTGELASKQVVLSELSGFVGGTPGGKADSASQLASAQPPKPPQDPARLLPTAPINLPRLRAAEVDIRYRAGHIEGDRMPLDDLQAHLILRDGQYRFEPLAFGVGEGKIVARMRLDGRGEVPKLDADIDFRRVDVSRLMAVGGGAFTGAGTIGGKAQLKAQGPSVSQMMAGGNGELQLFMQGGDVSALLVNLAGIDLGNSALSLLGIPRKAKVRCMVSDFGLKDGQLDTRLFLVDTSAANLVGKGGLDFRDESLDFRLRTEPKRLNVGSLATPIRFGGSLVNRSIYPEPKGILAKGGAAAALGLLFTPLAALIPTLQLGLGDNHDCEALIEQVRARSEQPVAAPRAGT